jgi:predicted phosphoribosyltransferase
VKSALRVFVDRQDAGAELARLLLRRGPLRPPVLVLGLPRGGVPVAYQVARALQAPLDVMLVRKIGMPGQPELAIGAVATGGILVREPRLTAELESAFAHIAARERQELERREQIYRPGLGAPDLADKTVILVDDGLATGSTMLAALRAARKAGAESVIAAAPVASHEAIALIGADADAIVVVQTPPLLASIGEWYEHFEQLEDSEVRTLLERSREDPHVRQDPRADGRQ